MNALLYNRSRARLYATQALYSMSVTAGVTLDTIDLSSQEDNSHIAIKSSPQNEEHKKYCLWLIEYAQKKIAGSQRIKDIVAKHNKHRPVPLLLKIIIAISETASNNNHELYLDFVTRLMGELLTDEEIKFFSKDL